ncbi:MAG: hypothetical protein EOO47_27195 [Flavobacterium sp.]|nr:MAG: hypothetical protein EOO47_27195 [Flavobacterium sp.]
MEELEPTHLYKLELAENLKEFYKGRGWRIALNFNRDEILFILPDGYDAKEERDLVYSILEDLPEIDHPEERVRIAFWVESEPRYNTQIEVINPDAYQFYEGGFNIFLNDTDNE